MGQIVALSENMINMIAAGEVIERPASVVKELLENSIDAQATKIAVHVEDGGRKLISVNDNGCGIDTEDLAQAFEPHATSKISKSSDLLRISTLGFRGEALASIASVAQVTAVSRPRPAANGQKDTASGSRIELDCGRKNNQTPCSADYGTTIQVRDLFYKLPARHKFLKTANTEMSHIAEHFTRIALAHNQLEMTLTENQRQVYHLAGNQSKQQRIAQLCSPAIAENLIETESSERNLHIYALMGNSSIARANNRFQYVFLNGRFIRDKFISHAIKEAYRGIIEPDRFGVVFLFIQMPYEDYDVNVHPTKVEVRFYNANMIHSQILSCLRQKLLSTQSAVSAKVPQTAVSPALQQQQGQIAEAMSEFFKRHKPVESRQHPGFSFSAPKGPAGTYVQRDPAVSQDIHDRFETGSQKSFLQIDDTFIVAQTADGFIIIDQHALHEHIIYEDLSIRIREGKLQSQQLLLPESFEVTPHQAGILKRNSEILEKMGIKVVPFGPRTMAIQAFPSLLSKVAPAGFVQDLLDLLAETAHQGLTLETVLHQVLSIISCRAAIKAGQKLNANEIEQLLADRERFENTSRCPHGRPTTIMFSTAELQKQFNRT